MAFISAPLQSLGLRAGAQVTSIVTTSGYTPRATLGPAVTKDVVIINTPDLDPTQFFSRVSDQPHLNCQDGIGQIFDLMRLPSNPACMLGPPPREIPGTKSLYLNHRALHDDLNATPKLESRKLCICSWNLLKLSVFLILVCSYRMFRCITSITPDPSSAYVLKYINR